MRIHNQSVTEFFYLFTISKLNLNFFAAIFVLLSDKHKHKQNNILQ